ncbi:MAG: glutathione-disulfide reductase [Steroidobacteraceae bacterium]
MNTGFDLIVIGGGSGGVACAQRAAEHGARVLLAESHRLGGTCVNLGCVPKKMMWNAAEIAHALQDGAGYGFTIDVRGHDWALLKRRRDEYIAKLNAVYETKLSRHGVELVRARARFTGPHEIELAGRRVRGAQIVIATGGRPLVPAIPGVELGITSDGFFALQSRPERVAIVGSGYVAVELAGIFAALGTRVILVLRGERVLRSFDSMLGETALAILREDGVEVVTNTWPATARTDGENACELELRDGRRLGPLDCVIWAIGRGAAVEGLGLDAAGAALDPYGFVETNAFQTTNVPHVHAIGDVSGRLQLTPVAIAAGRRLSDRLFGGEADRKLDYENEPTVIFAHPPIGTEGMSEGEARARYGDAVRIFRSGFVPLYHELTERRPRAEMKLVTVGADQRVVGCHIVGEGADEMLQGFAIAVRMGATKRDFDDTVAIHPTSAEELVTMR